jgi:hypothetical protein
MGSPLCRVFGWCAVLFVVNEGLLAQIEAGAVRQSAVVRGSVVSASDSAPVEGALVVVEPQGSPERVTGRYTQVGGTFDIAVPPASKYRIFAQKQGYLTPPDRVVDPTESGAITLRLVAQSVVAGRITGSAGEPLSGALVQVSRLQSRAGRLLMGVISQTATNDIGEYRIAGLEPGYYYLAGVYQDIASILGARLRPDVSPTDAGTQDYSLTYYPGTADVKAAKPFLLRAGQTFLNANISLEMAPSSVIKGVIHNIPIGAAAFTVVLRSNSMSGADRMFRVAPGRSSFEFRSVPSGEYALRADLRVGSQSFSGRRTIFVGSVTTDDASLSLEPSFPTQGSVSFEECSTRPTNVKLLLEGSDRNSIVPVEIDASDRFQIPALGADRYSIRVSDEGNVAAGVFVHSVVLDGILVRSSGVLLSRPNHSLVVKLRDTGGQIKGVAVDADHRPTADGSAVLASEEDVGLAYISQIESDGRFGYNNIPPGEYRIRSYILPAGVQGLTWDLIVNARSGGEKIKLGDKQRMQLQIRSSPMP